MRNIGYNTFCFILLGLSMRLKRGLSGVMGNYHAPFLGEGVAAMLPLYPTRFPLVGYRIIIIDYLIKGGREYRIII